MINIFWIILKIDSFTELLWINKNGFGLFVKPVLISFIPIEIKKYKFLEDSEDEIDDIIDDTNSIFLNPTNNNENNYGNNNETSVLKLNSIEDSLEIDHNTKFSSTSSDDMQPNSQLHETV